MGFDPNAASQPGSGVFGLPHTAAEARVVLVPVPFDATTSYGKGAADGPAAILAASLQVDLYDRETGRPYEAGIHMLPEPEELRAWNDEARSLAEPVIAAAGDLGDDPKLAEALATCNAISARVDEHVYTTVSRWLGAGKIVGTVGGDHAVPYGALRAHAERFPGLGLLHFDAHADLRPA